MMFIPLNRELEKMTAVYMMKRVILIVSILSAALVPSVAARTSKHLAIINIYQGDVRIVSGKRTVKAGTGLLLFEGDIIYTKKDSFVDLFVNETAVRVRENTVFIITRLRKDSNSRVNAAFFLKKGSSFFNISKKLRKGSSFNVQTRTLLASVRGTEFLVTDDSGRSSVLVAHGKVAAVVKKSKRKEAIVRHGEEAVAESNLSLSVKRVRKESLNRLRSLKESMADLQKDVRDKYRKSLDRARTDYDTLKETNQALGDSIKDDMKRIMDDNRR
jgi:hypothetical protein